MKYLNFLITLLLFFPPVFAQTGIAIEGGIGMSSMRFVPPTRPVIYPFSSTGALISGKIGALADVPLNKRVYFQAGLGVSRKGAVRDFSYYKNDSFNESVHQTLSIYYADLPLSVIYKSGLKGKGCFIAGLGATFSYILTGNNQLSDYQVFNAVLSSTNIRAKIINGTTIHAFDLGMNACVGYELPSGCFFRAYYTMGVNDIGVGTEVDKNRTWGISAGYFLSKKRNINKETDDLIDKGH